MPSLLPLLQEYLNAVDNSEKARPQYLDALRGRMQTLLDNPEHPCMNCGLPRVPNHHPDAGKSEHIGYIGTQYGCLPCAEKRDNGRNKIWIELFAWFTKMAEQEEMVHPEEAKIKMLQLEQARRLEFHESCRQMQEVPGESETVPGG